MKGIVKRFDGRTGFAVGEDGRTYFLHVNHISESLGNIKRAKNRLGKMKGGEIEFSPEDQIGRGKHPIARDITFDLTPKGWVPQHTDTGFWVINQDKDNPWRCSSCGHTSVHSYKFCPHCGVIMNRKKEDNNE